MAEKQEKSIIEIIQKMVREGESEAAIIKTLKELGVEPKKAKRLLLLGEADTFALLRGDITKIVQANIEKEKTDLKKILSGEIEKYSLDSEKKVLSKVIFNVQQYEKDLESQAKKFQEQINENIESVTFLSDRAKEKINELASAVRQVQMDMDEIRLKGISIKHKYISSMMIVLGIAFALIDLFLLATTFGQTTTSVDSLIITVLLALISITMLFVATLI